MVMRHSVPNSARASHPRGPLVFPASRAQSRLWLVEQIRPGSSAYNLCDAYRIAGEIDVPALGAAVDALFARQPALRTSFRVLGGRVTQVVAPSVANTLDIRDLTEAPQAVTTLIEAESAIPFDLARAPLARVLLLKVRSDLHYLVIIVHHIVSDGWSFGVIAKDLAALYRPVTAVAPLPFEPADLAVRDERRWSEERLRDEAAWWTAELADLALRPAQRNAGVSGTPVRFSLPPAVTSKLDELADRLCCTRYVVCLAVFGLALARQLPAQAFVIGTPHAAREIAGSENLVGYFVQMLPIRFELPAGRTFAELCARLQRRVQRALAHQEVPLERLPSRAGTERGPDVDPLFDAVFSYDDTPRHDLRLPDAQATLVESPNTETKFPISLIITPRSATFDALLEHSGVALRADQATAIAADFPRLAERACARPDTTVDDLVKD